MLNWDTVLADGVVIPILLSFIECPILDLTLQPRQGVILKLNLAARHPANHYHFLFFVKRVSLVYLRAIKEFECYLLVQLTSCLVDVIGELNDHMRISVRNYEALF